MYRNYQFMNTDDSLHALPCPKSLARIESSNCQKSDLQYSNLASNQTHLLYTPKVKERKIWRTNVKLISLTFQFGKPPASTLHSNTCHMMIVWPGAIEAVSPNYELRRLKLCVSCQQSQSKQKKKKQTLKKIKIKRWCMMVAKKKK